jgi:hypothetical protein
MTEEENVSVGEATAQAEPTQDVAPPQEADQQSSPQEAPQAVSNQAMSDQEYNWREARRQIDELRQKTEAQERYILSLNQQDDSSSEDDDDLARLADDDIVTAKQARGLASKMAREAAEEIIRQREASTAEDRLRAKFSDYDTVVTRDNIELLKQQDPELASSLYALSSDPYTQAVAAYKLLKRTGIGDMAKTQPQKARAIENSKKPMSVNAVTEVQR